MKAIYRQLGYVLLFFLPFYALFFCWSLVSYQPEKIIDTEESPQTIFSTAPKYLVYGRSVLENASKKIFLLGVSNVMYGFRPPQMQPLVPGYRIHNLAVGGSNITQIRQIVQLVYEAVPADPKGRNIFVLGMWYGLFADDQARWQGQDTNIDIEKLRSPLYRKENGRVEAYLPVYYLDYLTDLSRPFLFLDTFVNKYFPPPNMNIRGWIAEKLRGGVDQNTIVLDDHAKKYALHFWQKYMGPADGVLHEEQFALLKKLVHTIEHHHARLIIVDMPLPQWHMEESPFFRDYQRKKKQFLEEIAGSQAVCYLNYQDMDNDFDFWDSVHPKPMVTKKWSERLGNDLAKLCNNS